MEDPSRRSHMKVLFDVNVIIDVWGKTEDFAYSFEAMDVASCANSNCALRRA